MPLQLIRDIARAIEAYKDRQRIRHYQRQGYSYDNAKWLATNDKYINKALPVSRPKGNNKSGSRRW